VITDNRDILCPSPSTSHLTAHFRRLWSRNAPWMSPCSIPARAHPLERGFHEELSVSVYNGVERIAEKRLKVSRDTICYWTSSSWVNVMCLPMTWVEVNVPVGAHSTFATMSVRFSFRSCPSDLSHKRDTLSAQNTFHELSNKCTTSDATQNIRYVPPLLG